MLSLASGVSQAVDEGRVDGDALAGEGGRERGGILTVALLERGHVGAAAVGGQPRGIGHDHGPDGQAKLAGEFEVAFVVGGHGHDGAGAVAHKHVVGDPDADLLVIDRVDGVGASESAGLFLAAGHAVAFAAVGGRGAVAFNGFAAVGGGDVTHQGMLGREHHVRGAVERVGPGGEDGDDRVFVVGAAGQRGWRGGQLEIDLRAHALPDPVALHFLQRFRPFQRVQVSQQAVGVGRDTQQPLTQRAALDGEVAAFAAPVDDLFIGQHGAQGGAPVDGDFVHVREALTVDDVALLGGGEFGPGALDADLAGDGLQAFLHAVELDRSVGPDDVVCVLQLVDQMADGLGLLVHRVEVAVEELEKDPLGPAVVFGIGGVDFAVPVVAEAEHLDLPAKVGDVAFGGDTRMGVVLDGVLLGRETEGVPAHGMQHVDAGHAQVARDDVGGGVAFGVANVEASAAGVGEHVQDVGLGHLVGVGGIEGSEGLVGQPMFLPLALDGGEVVSHGIG